MTTEHKIHDKYKKEIMEFLNCRGFKCVDYEKETEGLISKKPDIKEKKNEIFIEIKILLLNNNLETEKQIINSDLKNKKVASYWFVDTPNFRGHLDDCRRKFRQYPKKKTMVVFINLMGYQEQSIEELLSGKESYNISMTNDGKRIQTDCGYRNREIRSDKNTEIGIIAEYIPKEKRLVIIHNAQVDEKRKISEEIFKNVKDIEQKKYEYSKKNNKFK